MMFLVMCTAQICAVLVRAVGEHEVLACCTSPCVITKQASLFKDARHTKSVSQYVSPRFHQAAAALPNAAWPRVAAWPRLVSITATRKTYEENSARRNRVMQMGSGLGNKTTLVANAQLHSASSAHRSSQV
jgi:hypothetical protein